MQIKRGSLIGIENWNPLGESILGIISRLSTLNYLLLRDVKTVFFLKFRKGIIPKYATDARTSNGIDVHAVTDLFEDIEDIWKSFPNYYYDEKAWGKCGNSYIDENIRICRKCAKLGKHLTIHQLKLFDLCPIHSSSLLKTCIKCGSELGQFAIDTAKNDKEVFNSFRCKHCGHENIDYTNKSSIRTEKEFRNKLGTFLTEQGLWIKSSNRRYSNKYWIYEGVRELILREKVTSCELPTMKEYLQSSHKYYIGRATYTKEAHDELVIPKGLPLHPEEYIEVKALTFNLTQFANDFLSVLRKQFAISNQQLSTAKLVTQYNNVFWGPCYTVWACAYLELEDAVLFRYRHESQLTGCIYTRQWLIECWYDYFACGLLEHFDLLNKNDIYILFRISRVWLKKFLTNLYVREVRRICKNLFEFSEQVVANQKLVEKLNVISSYDGIKLLYIETDELIEIIFCEKGPRFIEIIDLYKSGFRGFSSDMHLNYENYKVIHDFFDSEEKFYNYKDYVTKISALSTVKLET